jgi:hypothetical protein
VPDSVDPDAQDLTVALRGTEEIYRVTIPAGTLDRKASSRTFVLRDPTGSFNGIRELRFRVTPQGAGRLRLRTGPVDVPPAAESNQFVAVTLTIGNYAASHERRWLFRGKRLQTR